MKEIKRYGTGFSGQVIETKQGSFVDYDDHAAIVAALQEQVRSLAAENEVLRNVFGPGEAVLNFLTIALRHTTYDEIDLSDVSLAFKMSLPETPATDAVIREIGAKAVDLSECRTLWYEHDDLSSEVECIPTKDIKKAIRAAGYKVKT